VELRSDSASFVQPIWPTAFPACALGTLFPLTFIVVLDADDLILERDWLLFVYLVPAAYVIGLVGLLVLGLPLTHLIKRAAFSRWSLLLGLLIGGLMGRLVTGLMGLDPGFSIRATFESMGFLFGASIGFFWSLLVRKRLVEMQQKETSCTD